MANLPSPNTIQQVQVIIYRENVSVIFPFFSDSHIQVPMFFILHFSKEHCISTFLLQFF